MYVWTTTESSVSKDSDEVANDPRRQRIFIKAMAPDDFSSQHQGHKMFDNFFEIADVFFWQYVLESLEVSCELFFVGELKKVVMWTTISSFSP